MNVLITGGNGFIGTRLVDRLIKERHRVTIIDIKPQPPESFMHKTRQFTISAGDRRCDPVFADAGFDLVIHLACQPLPFQYDQAYSEILHGNLSALGNILYLARKYAVAKVIVLIDGQIYGSRALGPRKEADPVQPDTDTGLQELIREKCCQAYRQQGLNVTCIRTGIVYGPAVVANPEPVFIRQLWGHDASSQQARMSEASRIDCLYVNDLVEALVRVCENQTSPVLNIAAGQCSSFQEVKQIIQQTWQAMANETGARPLEAAWPEQPDQTAGGDSPEWSPDEPSLCLDRTLAAFELDFTPRYTLAEGIRKSIEEYCRLPDKLFASHPHPPDKILPRIWAWLTTPDVENLLLLLLFGSATFYARQHLGLDFDFLWLYLIVVNLFFGLKIGWIAIALAIFLRLTLVLFVDDMRLSVFVANGAEIANLIAYLVVGFLVGMSVDKIRQKEESYGQEIEQLTIELKDLHLLYHNCTEIKHNLQMTIAQTEDSLAKAIQIIKRLDEPDLLLYYANLCAELAQMFQVPSVLIYSISADETFLRLAGSKGLVEYPRTIQAQALQLVRESMASGKIVLNTALIAANPAVCATVRVQHKPVAVIFLDRIDIQILTQNFLFTLESVIELVAYSLEKNQFFELANRSIKFHSGTRLIRQNWFEKLIDTRRKLYRQEQASSAIFYFKMEADQYEAFVLKIAGRVRAADQIGEVEHGLLGILMDQVGPEDLPLIKRRLESQEIAYNWADVVR